jgi:hypothetical protein
MESLRKLLEKVNTENPTSFDLKIVSLSNYYIGLERRRDIKKIRRLKLLVHLYPSIIEKNAFRSIQALVEDPSEKTLIVIRNPEKITAIEHELIQKYYGDIVFNGNNLKPVFKVLDLYECFGLNDKKS